MQSALLGDGAKLAPLKHLIIEKTEGNPLFMEEIFQALRSVREFGEDSKTVERSSFWKGTQAKDRVEKVYVHKGTSLHRKAKIGICRLLRVAKKLLLY